MFGHARLETSPVFGRLPEIRNPLRSNLFPLQALMGESASGGWAASGSGGPGGASQPAHGAGSDDAGRLHPANPRPDQVGMNIFVCRCTSKYLVVFFVLVFRLRRFYYFAYICKVCSDIFDRAYYPRMGFEWSRFTVQLDHYGGGG